jgi:ribosomal protein S18 acetylase RimI-like enzyme
MSLEIKQSPLTPRTLEHFNQVLRDRPDEYHRLTRAVDETGTRLFQAIFNGRSVGLLLLRDTETQPVVDTVVVHPATRGRGVGRSLLEQASRVLGTEPRMPDACQKR